MNAHATPAGSASEYGIDAPTFLSPTDIYETKDAVVMFLDMPGADPDSLDVTVERHDLSISAQVTPTLPEGYVPVHAEYREGNYERAFALSDQVDREHIEAIFKDGVLQLRLPKITESSPAKKIAVKSA
jgi:HSP20 family molecular chaperone IbpA